MADETSVESKRRPRFDVVGFGALNLDHLYAVPQLIQDGGVEVLTSTTQPGGSAANTIYGLAKLGLRCGFVGVVGDDRAGQAILDSFEEVGVDTSSILVRPGTKSGQTICITAGEGQKAIYIIPGANRLLDSRDIDPAYLSDTRYVHLSSFVGEDVFSQQSRVVEKLPSQTKISLALDALYSRRGLKAIGPVLKRSTLLFANADELHELTGEELPAAAHTCLSLGCQVVVVTFGAGRKRSRGRASRGDQEVTVSLIVTQRGTKGRPEFTEHRLSASSTHDGPIVDTTGAGDAFAASFLFGLLQECKLPVCGALGHTAAGFSLTALGARAALPTRQELWTRFDQRFRSLFADELGSRDILGSLRTE